MAPPCDMPNSGNFFKPCAATTASRSSIQASNEVEGGDRSDNPQPRWSYRIYVWSRDSSSSQCVQTGLRASYSTWLSQCAVRSSGGPLPIAAIAICAPSRDLQNRICCPNFGMNPDANATGSRARARSRILSGIVARFDVHDSTSMSAAFAPGGFANTGAFAN